MNVRDTAAQVEFAAEREQAAQDEIQHQREQRVTQIVSRSDEIYKARMIDLSIEDMALAFEIISTMPKCLEGLRDDIRSDHRFLGDALIGLVSGALKTDSLDQANREFAAMDRKPVDGELH